VPYRRKKLTFAISSSDEFLVIWKLLLLYYDKAFRYSTRFEV